MYVYTRRRQGVHSANRNNKPYLHRALLFVFRAWCGIVRITKSPRLDRRGLLTSTTHKARTKTKKSECGAERVPRKGGLNERPSSDSMSNINETLTKNNRILASTLNTKLPPPKKLAPNMTSDSTPQNLHFHTTTAMESPRQDRHAHTGPPDPPFNEHTRVPRSQPVLSAGPPPL